MSSNKIELFIHTGMQVERSPKNRSIEMPLMDPQLARLTRCFTSALSQGIKTTCKRASVPCPVFHESHVTLGLSAELYIKFSIEFISQENNHDGISEDTAAIMRNTKNFISGDLEQACRDILSTDFKYPHRVKLSSKKNSLKNVLYCKNELQLNCINAIRSIRANDGSYIQYQFNRSEYTLEIGDICKRAESIDSKNRVTLIGMVFSVSDKSFFELSITDSKKKHEKISYQLEHDEHRNGLLDSMKNRTAIEIIVVPIYQYLAGEETIISYRLLKIL